MYDYVCITYFLMMSFDGKKSEEDFIWCLQFDKKNETKNLSTKLVLYTTYMLNIKTNKKYTHRVVFPK